VARKGYYAPRHAEDAVETARREVRTLIEMTEGKEGPYVSYLHVIERDLKQKLGRPS